MIKVAVVGLGKMGLSHLSMFNAHPDVTLAATCDSSTYALSVLSKYTGIPTFTDYDRMLREVALDAVVIATPSRSHAPMVRKALARGLHIFCEKPFTLAVEDGIELAATAREKGVVTQVGYHNRFVGAFREVKTLLEAGAIGEVTHALGEAYGPVVLKAKGSTWRSRRDEGGGCLRDYAAHPIDLLNWYLGDPVSVGGTVLRPVFSQEIEDQVCTTVFFPEGRTAQVSANWSDESQRKMTTRVSIWGTNGHIFADRQECQVFLRDTATVPPGYEAGWNVRYTTDLTKPVWFYLRGEEYSAQVDYFIGRVKEGSVDGLNSFDSAMNTDRVISMMLADEKRDVSPTVGDNTSAVDRRAHQALQGALTGLRRLRVIPRAARARMIPARRSLGVSRGPR